MATATAILTTPRKNGVMFSFMDIDCVACIDRYNSNGATQLNIIAADTENNRNLLVKIGAIVCVASVNMEEYHRLDPEEVAIKNYSECRGLLPVLTAAHIVTLTNARLNSPYGLLPVVRINAENLAEL